MLKITSLPQDGGPFSPKGRDSRSRRAFHKSLEFVPSREEGTHSEGEVAHRIRRVGLILSISESPILKRAWQTRLTPSGEAKVYGLLLLGSSLHESNDKSPLRGDPQ